MEPHQACPRTPHTYTFTEWSSLKSAAQRYHVPVAFDRLLAPNLPVDSMRVLRFWWFKTWGRVRPNTMMPPERVAALLPEWAEAVTATEWMYNAVEATYYDLIWNGDDYPDLDKGQAYRAYKKVWAILKDEVEAYKTTDEFVEEVERYRNKARRTAYYKNLTNPTLARADIAAAFGARSTRRPTERGRTRGSIKLTLDSLAAQGLLVLTPHSVQGVYTVECGPELFHLLTRGDFTPSYRRYLGATTPPSEPFFRLRPEGLVPSKRGFDGLDVSLGEHWSAPTAMECLFERYLPSSLMPAIWYVAANTIGRHVDEHPTLGYVEVSTKQMARLFGPARATTPRTRGRRVRSVRDDIDWAVEHGILDRRRSGSRTELSFGPELWHAIRRGRFSPALGALLGGEQARVEPLPESSRQDRFDRMERALRTMSSGKDFYRAGMMIVKREARAGRAT